MVNFSFQRIAGPPIIVSPSRRRNGSFSRLTMDQGSVVARGFKVLLRVDVLLNVHGPVRNVWPVKGHVSRGVIVKVFNRGFAPFGSFWTNFVKRRGSYVNFLLFVVWGPWGVDVRLQRRSRVVFGVSNVTRDVLYRGRERL